MRTDLKRGVTLSNPLFGVDTMFRYICAGCDNKCNLDVPMQIGKPWLCPIKGINVSWNDATKIQIDQDDDHPAYYGGSDNPYEAIKVIEANGWMEGFCLGNVHKYTVRKGKKTTDALEDLRKARDYLNFYIKHLEGMEHE